MNGNGHIEYSQDEFSISTDTDRLDIAFIHNFLSNAYWSPGIHLDTVKTAVEHSLCFGLYSLDEQIGFGRVVTDYATLAYMKDVFVIEAYRGRGLGKWLVECIMTHPGLRDVRRWVLNTDDAHNLYARFGFVRIETSHTLMVRQGS